MTVSITLTDKEASFLKFVMDTWIPSTPSGRITKAEGKLCDSIIDKIQKQNGESHE